MAHYSKYNKENAESGKQKKVNKKNSDRRARLLQEAHSDCWWVKTYLTGSQN